MIQADLLVRDALREAFQAVNENPDLLRTQVFVYRPEDEQQVILDYFVNVVPRVTLGFPIQPAELPGCFVAMAQAPEERQPVGSDFAEEDRTPSVEQITEIEGTWFRPTVRAGCYAVQADAAAYLAAVTTWGLLRYREALQEAGLHEQVLAQTDFEPAPEWLPDLVFRREVLLSGIVAATVPQAFLKIAAVQVTAHGEAPYGGGSITVVDRTTRRRRR